MKGLTPGDRERIRGKIAQYAANPSTLANQVIPLKGSDFLRLRVNDYRVIFAVGAEDNEVIGGFCDDKCNIDPSMTLTVMVVYRVRHRREAYDHH